MAKNSKELQKEVLSADFEKFCRQNFQTLMLETEKKRKLHLGAIIGIILLCIIIEPIIFYVSYINGTYSVGTISIMVVLPMIVNPICIWISKRYKTKAKQRILPELLSYVGKFEILNKKNVKEYLTSYIRSIGLFSAFDKISFDDCLRGKYNDVEFNILETHLTDVSKSNRTGLTTDEKTVFKGLFICFKSFKNFKHKTIIKKETNFSSKGNKTVNLEDPEFEKLYQVTSDDQIEARYLITPAFMNRMVELNQKEIGKTMTISFAEGNVNIATSADKDWFELSLFKPATNIENYRNILLELITVFSIIDTLKFDKNINM